MFDHVFFEVGKFENQVMHRWVYILASPDVAKNYFFHATLKGKTDRKISAFCQARSLNESMAEIIANREVTSKYKIQKISLKPPKHLPYDRIMRQHLPYLPESVSNPCLLNCLGIRFCPGHVYIRALACYQV